MAGIDRGSPGAWRTWQLIEVWATADDDFGDSDAERAYQLFEQIDGEIVRNLITLVAGSVDAFVVLTGRSLDDALSHAWIQLAMGEEEDDAGQTMHAAVTAWLSGDETWQALLDSGQLDEHDPVTFVIDLLGVLFWLGQRIVAVTGEPADNFLTGLAISLGTGGSPPVA